MFIPQIKHNNSRFSLRKILFRITQISSIIIISTWICSQNVRAQVSYGGSPTSFSTIVQENIPEIVMPPLNIETLLIEDEIEQEEAKQAGKLIPPRFGYAFSVEYSIDDYGKWEYLSDGGKLWRMRIRSIGAYSINLIFSDYWLPPDAKFFLYNEDHSMVKGAFTNKNNKDNGKFSTGLIRGDAVVLEYYEPANSPNPGFITISQVIHGYRDLFNRKQVKKVLGRGSGNDNFVDGWGDSGECNYNVACKQQWRDEKRSVVMILIDQNTRLCSGFLVNKANQDKTPYILTAAHCADTDRDGVVETSELTSSESWLFWFNYESSTCNNPQTEPDNDEVDGCDTIAFVHPRDSLDFYLVELSQDPPQSYGVFFAGWSKDPDARPYSTVCIHHPSTDIKKYQLMLINLIII